MARNIGATLSLNNGNFFTNMKSAISASNNLKSTLNGTTTGMKTFGSQSSSTGNIITSLASKAAVAVGAFVSIRQAVNFGKDVVNTGMQFEQGMANVSAISGATGAELTALSDKAKEMGTTTKFSALEAADAMSYMGMAGWNSSQMIDGIAGIMNLAAASGEELASVSDIVTDALTAFGLKASDSAQFADVLAVASSKSNTNVSLLGESFKNVAATAGAMGYSMQDTTTALGLMANAGIKGSDAGTSLRGVMTRLAKPTAEVKQAMTALGISAVNTDGSMKPLSTLIPELQTAFSSLTDSEKGQYATMIAGKNALSGFLSIVNSSPDDFYSLSDAINNSEGAAQSMADTMNDTVSGKLTLLKSQFEGVKIAIFDALGSSQFKGVLQSMSDGLGALTPSISGVTVAIGNGLFYAIQGIYNIGMTVFTAVKTAVENNQPAIEKLHTAFDNVKNSIINAFSGNGTALIQTLANVIIPTLCNSLSLVLNIASGVISVASTLSPVIAGIAGTVTAYKIAVTAANVVEGIRNGLIAFSAVMTGTQAAAFAPLTTATIAQIAATSALNVVTGVFGAIMTFVTSPIGLVVIAIGAVIAIGVALYKHWDTVKQWAGNLWNGIKNIFNGIKNTISNAWNGVKETASNVWGAVKDTVSEKLNNIKTAYQEHGGGIKGAAAGAMEAVKGYYTAGYTFINNLTGGKLGQVVDSVKTKLSPMVNTVKEKLSGVKDAFGSAFSNAFEFVKNSYNEGALKPVADKVVSAFSAVKTAIAEKFTGIKDAIGEKLTAVGDAASGVKDKIAAKFTTVKDAVVEKFNSIKAGVAVALASIIEVVSNIVGGVRSVVTTIIEGIRTHIGNAAEAVRTTITNIIEGIKLNFQNFFTSIRTVFENIKAAVSGIFEGIKTVVSGVFQTIVGIFTLNLDTIKGGVQNVITGITVIIDGAKQVVMNVWNAITSAATLAFNNIRTVVTNVIEEIKTVIQSIKDTFSNVFNSVKNIVSNVFNSIKTTISNVWKGIKNLIKAPHIVQTGTISIAGISTPIPKLGIQWYAKGGIMTRPTMFGMNGGNAMVGGESGAEAVLPLDMLWSKLAQFLTPQPASDRPNITNYIEVKVYSGNDDDETLANKVAARIVEVIENM
ncbi:MAG: phage tail tape measure protein [Clostridia bacterium]|nr:phage tail tape measure protein [Clostridia bacterium]DAR25144.1 MAG TPA: minor tail protein [Caudoviricetes sp.]